MAKVLIEISPTGAIGFQAEGVDAVHLIGVLEIVKQRVIHQSTDKKQVTLVRMPDGSLPPPGK